MEVIGHQTVADDPHGHTGAGLPDEGHHFFTFGGVRRTAEWISGYLRRPLAVGEPVLK